MLFLGIDTSNYTTSAAICGEDGEIIANLKSPLPVREGECGLRQSDAVFAHIKNLPELMQRVGRAVGGERIAAIGVSATPRDASGSYMPCFLSGVAAAEAMAAACGAPLYRTSHQNGHIRAALYSSGGAKKLLGGRFLAFHVSGGTTEALLCEPREVGFEVREVGGTRDLNAGQAIDRIGVMLGMKFPCGPALERAAEESVTPVRGVRVSVEGGYCNLSGLQNLAEGMKRRGESDADIARFTLAFISKTLMKMSISLREQYGELSILYAGGVMSNGIIRSELTSLGETYFAAPEYSADNAAGVALLCRDRYIYENERK